jgi:hypothetical protein
VSSLSGKSSIAIEHRKWSSSLIDIRSSTWALANSNYRQSPILEQSVNTQAYAVHILQKIWEEHVDLLEQIRFELDLHYDYKNELKAFNENTKKICKLKAKNKEMFTTDMANNVSAALDRFVCFLTRYAFFHPGLVSNIYRTIFLLTILCQDCISTDLFSLHISGGVLLIGIMSKTCHAKKRICRAFKLLIVILIKTIDLFILHAIFFSNSYLTEYR